MTKGNEKFFSMKFFKKKVKPPYSARELWIMIGVAVVFSAIPATVLLTLEGFNITSHASIISKIWLEAEDGAISSPMALGNDTNASAGKYVASSVTNTSSLITQPKVAGATDQKTKTVLGVTSFLATFDGAPTSPLPLGGLAGKSILPDWDIQVHSRDTGTWDNLETQDDVMHGPDCSAPPAMHTNNTYEGAVFNCANHIMTAIQAGGYGVIYLTPDVQVDWTNGPATVDFDMSTEQMSRRDWVDWWLTPYQDNLALPFSSGAVDLQSVPVNGLHIDLDDSQFAPFLVTNVNNESFFWNRADSTPVLNSGIDPSTNQSSVRQHFRITVSRTHVKFERFASATGIAITYIDVDIPDLGYTKAVFQFGQHSYNPYKDGAGVAATWHWDNVAISPAVPFTIIHSDQRYVSDGETVTFDAPAPANSYIHFSAIGIVRVNGTLVQPQIPTIHNEHFNSYFVPIAQGATSATINLSTDNWYTGPFRAQDFSIWSLTPPGNSNPPPPPDTTPPTVSITAPTNNATVSGNVSITANASDASGVSSVEFSVDGQQIQLPDTNAPYQATFNSANLFDGTHTISARALDPFNNAATATITVTTSNNNHLLPSNTGSSLLNFSVPEDGSYIVWTRLLATNTGSDSYWLKVDSQPGVKVGDGSVTTGSYQWVDFQNGNTSQRVSFNLTAGSHTLQLIGREAGTKLDRLLVTNDPTFIPTGKDGNGDQVVDNVNPIAAVASPTNNAVVFGAPGIIVNASDNVGVTKVEAYVDNVKVGETSTKTNSSYNIAWDSTSLNNGTHTIFAKAYDAAGNNTITTSINVNVVNNDTQAPTVSITLPTANQTVSGNLVITTNSQDNIGVTKVDFYIDGVLINSDTTAPFSYTLSTILLTNGAHTVSVRAYDSDGNNSPSSPVSINVNNALTSRKIGDINGDGKVDIFDLSILLSKWGTGYTAADLNSNSSVDVFDLSILLAHWGT